MYLNRSGSFLEIEPDDLQSVGLFSPLSNVTPKLLGNPVFSDTLNGSLITAHSDPSMPNKKERAPQT
jgi:hypothetical protein